MQNYKEKVLEIKKQLKDKILIAAHHYQNQDIIDIADYVGDSYLLAKKASQQEKENIILCGVKFMAETAKILAKENQNVYIPDINAGCPLAKGVSIKDLQLVFDILKNKQNLDIVPVTYVNSYVDIKAFTGKYNGSCCTSSNAEKIIRYFLNQKKKIVFLPDFYLGKNSANKIGNIKTKAIFKKNEININLNDNNSDIDIFLWNSFCPIHQVYTPEDIYNFRDKYPGIKIVVHPESKVEVVNLSDYSGSTEYIYNLIKNSKPGSIWAIGTESTFVNRLKKENPDKKIFSLKESFCKNMQRINLENTYNLLESINNNKKNVNQIIIDEEDRYYGRIALENMIKIVEN